MPKNVAGVIREFQAGQLHAGSSTGRVVTNPRQAVAIALSEQAALTKPPAVRRTNTPAQQHPHRNLGHYLHARKGR